MKPIGRAEFTKIRRRLFRLYGDQAERLMERLHMMIGRYGVGLYPVTPDQHWTENDVLLITYADMVQKDGEPPLQTLHRFCQKRLRGAIKGIHILPFYPWSSDDGFSVKDYRKVEESYGSWDDVEAMGRDFDLMFDLVLNHCSAEGPWFKDYVNGIYPARGYFVEESPETDLSAVVRPRQSPLLTAYDTRSGVKHIWTTFSADQVDLDWKNPDLLFEFIDIFFLYIAKGVRIIRLDAVAFLWKEPGTSCIHLPETHEMVKLLRDIVEIVDPKVIILTETNVPHEENISYFGEGDEAHMVYNFSLPPLLLHGLLRGDASHLTKWAASLPKARPGCTFFNFTASHDGIGVRPLQGLLDPSELDWVIERVKERGGRISYKANADGSSSPYEMNISYLDALSVPEAPKLSARRFLCSQAVALALRGVPAVYFHSLVGTHNDYDGLEEKGYNRAINRRKWDLDDLKDWLDTPADSDRVFQKYLTFLRRRAGHPAFHPDGDQIILDLGSKLFGLIRTSPSSDETVLCLFNFTYDEQKVRLVDVSPSFAEAGECRELLTGNTFKPGSGKHITLAPFQAMWLSPR